MSRRLCQPLRYVCVTNAHVYVPRVVSIYGLVTRFVIRVTRPVALMEQELHTRQKEFIRTLYSNAVRQVICECCILLTRGKLLHEHIISLSAPHANSRRIKYHLEHPLCKCRQYFVRHCRFIVLFWLLHCLSFNLRVLITPLVSN